MFTFFHDLFAPPRHLILLVLATWLGLAFAEKRTEQIGISKEALNNITFYSLLGYVIGGRLLFAATHLSTFAKSPMGIFSLNPDLFDALGAAASAILVGLIYGHRQKLFFWATLDSLTFLISVLAIGVSLAHLAAGTAFGMPTALPWGIDLWNATRHPTQIYELLASTLIFILLWLKKPYSLSGLLFLTFATLTAFSRNLIEAFRGDSIIVFGGFRQSQLIAWLIMVLCFIGFEYILRPGKENMA